MIKWVGIVRDAAQYERGELPAGARRLDAPQDIGEMMVRALPFAALPMALVCAAMFVKVRMHGAPVVSFAFVLLGVLVGLALLPVHELLHAAAYPKEAVVHIGVMPRQMAAVALASWPLTRRRFVVMSLLPVVLGALPLMLFAALPGECRAAGGLLFGMAVMGLISPYPDYAQVFCVMRQTRKGCTIQLHEGGMYVVDGEGQG